MSQNGKGSKPRPTDLKKYQENFEDVFREKLGDKKFKSLQDTIMIETAASEKRQKRKVKIIKEYTDQNGIEMVIVNINDSLTNKVIDKRLLQALEHDVVNKDAVTTIDTQSDQ